MKNGIVILNYNDSENTSLFLKNIKDFNILDYIVVVDNKSTDDSLKKLKVYENNKIKIVEAKANKGYASGNNVGIKYLIENFDIDNIIISNPDIVVKEEDIKMLIQDLKNQKISVIAPNVKEPYGVSRGWKLPTFFSEFLSSIPILRRFEQTLLSYRNENYQSDLTQVDVVKGCFFIIKKDAFEDINFFDENTFLYYEENIMAKKLQNKGYITCVDNRVTIIHALSQSVDKNIRKLEKFKYLKSSQYYYEKSINKLNIFKLMILKVLNSIYFFGLKVEKIIIRR